MNTAKPFYSLPKNSILARGFGFVDRTDKPLVVFFHCNSGLDRTGEVAISYFYHKGSLPEKAYVYGTTYFNFNPDGSAYRVREPIANPNHPFQSFLNCADAYCGCTYENMDKSTVPGTPGSRYPCPYPWSTSCN